MPVPPSGQGHAFADTTRTQNVARSIIKSPGTEGRTNLIYTVGVERQSAFKGETDNINIAVVDDVADLGYAVIYTTGVNAPDNIEVAPLGDVALGRVFDNDGDLHIKGTTFRYEETNGFYQGLDGRWRDFNGDLATPSGTAFTILNIVASSGDTAISENPPYVANLAGTPTEYKLSDRSTG